MRGRESTLTALALAFCALSSARCGNGAPETSSSSTQTAAISVALTPPSASSPTPDASLDPVPSAPDSAERERVQRALAADGSRRAAEQFLDLEGSPFIAATWAASGRAEALEVFRTTATTDPSWRRRATAVGLMAFVAERRALAALLAPVLNDPVMRVRVIAITHLGRADGGCARLVELLRDPSIEVRAAALWGIRETRDRGALPFVLEVLDRPNEPSVGLELPLESKTIHGYALRVFDSMVPDSISGDEARARAWLSAHPVGATKCPPYVKKR